MKTAIEYNAWADGKVWTHKDLPQEWPGSTHLPGSQAFAQEVAHFQRGDDELENDGKLGPRTYEALRQRFPAAVNAVIIHGVPHVFPGPVVQQPGLESTRRLDPIVQVVLHVDVTWTSTGAYQILKKRGLSSHFGVDGDVGRDGYSTLHQWLDPGTRYAHHAGKANKRSIGIDLNTPLSMKYQKRDERGRGIARPVVQAEVFGKMRTNLGAFPEQVKTLVALAELFERVLDIPRTWPRHQDGTPITEHIEDAHSFSGWTGHHHHPTTHYCPGAAGVVIVDELCPRKG